MIRNASLTIALALSCAALPASAQDASERARTLFEAGVQAMDRGSPQEASGYFDQSYQLYPRASTACNMAQAQERMGRPCDAQSWYRQCAALDRENRFTDHANRQAAALASQCTGQVPVHDPFVRQPAVQGSVQATVAQPGNVQIVESGSVEGVTPRGADHTLLAVGITGIVLGGGALVGGILAAQASHDEANLISVAEGVLVEGTEDADHYYRAAMFSDLSLGLYVGAGLVGALGVILTLVDLAQPNAFGGQASREDPSFALAASPDGVFGALSLRF